MYRILFASLLLLGCEPVKKVTSVVPQGTIEWVKVSTGEKHVVPAGEPPPRAETRNAQEVPTQPPTIKGKPTWDIRSFVGWRKTECDTSGHCSPMGRATFLVEFGHLGCRTFKQVIDDQAALIQGYAPEHQFVLVIAASDALTRELFDYVKTPEPPCRVFLYNDTPKSDLRIPNEDQWFVELCKNVTLSDDGECHSQLSDKRLYTP